MAQYIDSDPGERQPLLSSASELEVALTASGEQVEHSLVRKLDRRMAILILMHMLNCIDRNIMSAARLRGLEEELHLKGRQFDMILAAFYLSYFFMQVPSNMFLDYYGKPSKYLPWNMVSWGVVSVGTGFVTNYAGALWARLLLGFLQAAFYPGALLLLSKWYRPNELSQRIAYIACGNFVSNAFGSLVASGILNYMGGILGLSAWRWLFIIKGAVTIIVATWALFVLPDFPENASNWLRPNEKRIAVARMANLNVNGPDYTPFEDATSKGRWPGLYLAISDGKVWWLSLTLSCLTITQSFGLYFPTLCATLGYGPIISLLLCAPPWLFAAGTSLYLTRHSDKVGERFSHIAFPSLIGIVGFALAKSTMNIWVRYISLFLTMQAVGGPICFMAWASSSVAHPPAKRAVALAIINSIGQFGNAIGSFAWPPSWGPTYGTSFSICICTGVLGLVMCLFFRLYIASINHAAEMLEREQGVRKGYRYML